MSRGYLWGHVRDRIRVGMGSGRRREEHDGQRREQLCGRTGPQANGGRAEGRGTPQGMERERGTKRAYRTPSQKQQEPWKVS